jgi:hypothetical protein
LELDPGDLRRPAVAGDDDRALSFTFGFVLFRGDLVEGDMGASFNAASLEVSKSNVSGLDFAFRVAFCLESAEGLSADAGPCVFASTPIDPFPFPRAAADPTAPPPRVASFPSTVAGFFRKPLILAWRRALPRRS